MGARRLQHHDIHLRAARHVVAERELRRSPRPRLEPRVVRDRRARPQREAEAVLQVEEGDGTVRILATDDPPCREAQPIAIERDGALEVVHPQRDDGQSRSHASYAVVGISCPSARRGR